MVLNEHNQAPVTMIADDDLSDFFITFIRNNFIIQMVKLKCIPLIRINVDTKLDLFLYLIENDNTLIAPADVGKITVTRMS